jgi:hypothetical protein
LIVPPITFPNQVSLSGAQPFVNQLNFGQITGQICSWNPNASSADVQNFINYIVRVIYSKKTWYGTWRKLQIVCPAAVTGGTATVTYNSNVVQGVNTSWDNTLIGRQFRTGLNNPIYTIVNVDFEAQQLILELPWAGPLPPSQSTQTTGYNIVQMYYNLGGNIKYIKTCVNVQLGYKMKLNWTQDLLNKIDPWRIWVNFPIALAPLPTDPNGNYLVECWPAPFVNQAFPATAYTQPANLQDDLDQLPPYIRADVVVLSGIAWVLRHKPKINPYYSEAIAVSLASDFDKKFMAAIEDMWNEDENLYRTSSTITEEDYPEFTPGGDIWSATHAIMGDAGVGLWG